MRVTSRFFAVACLTLSLLSFESSKAVDFPGNVEKLQVASNEKDIPLRTVYKWTPPVPEEQVNSLPVVYVLHGWPGSPNGMMTGTINALNDSFNAGASPFMAVFPDGNAKTHIDSEWADSHDGKAMVETWLTTNVIKAVEGENLRPKSQRALLGFSMGGYGAAIIGLHHPDLYSHVVTLAGYFVVDDLTNAFGFKPNNKTKVSFQTPSNFLKKANQIRWFMGEATQDYTALIHGQADSWAKKLKANKASYKITRIPGSHNYTFVSAAMDPVAKWFKWA